MRSSDRRYYLPVVLLLVFSLISISIGFSAMSTTLTVNGNAAFIPVDMIRFTALETYELNDAYETSKSFLTTDLNFTLELDELSSSATYDVTLSNLGQVNKILTGINNEIYSNNDITYELSGIGLNTVIRKGEDIHFKISFKYKNGITLDDTQLNAKLKFMFDDYINLNGAYVVTFDANGGTGVMADMQYVQDEYKKLIGNTFTREGYFFNGWNTKADGSGKNYRNKENVRNINNGADTIILYAQWVDNLDNIYYPGTCEFGGKGFVVVGDCSDGENDYINTNIKPFTEENYQRNFILKFTIDSVDPSRFSANKRDTIFNILYEASDKIKGIYPGTLLRIEGGKWQLQGGNGKSNATKVTFNKDALIGQEFKLIRHNDGSRVKLYYAIGDNDPVFLRDMTELYAPFDTPLSFGANLQIDNTTPDRHSYATLSDIEFSYLEDGLTLYEILNGQSGGDNPGEELETVFSLDGPCSFNGTNGFIEGNKCDDYHDAYFINTGVQLFNEDNYEKDFEVSFELDDYVTSEQKDDQVTIFNAFLERTGLGYGTVLRRNKNKFDLIVRDGTGVSQNIAIDVSNPMVFRLVKKDGNVCYSINNNNLTYINNISNFAEPFNVPLTFGGSIDKYGEPFRYINGTLSNMSIKMGTVEDYCGP